MSDSQWFTSCPQQWQTICEKLKHTPCPHCKAVGMLIRHGFLYGYDDQSPQRKTLRARRIFCSNRNNRRGCGRTFSVWMADKIRRLSMTASTLWTFLSLAVRCGIFSAIRSLRCSLSDRTVHRIWRRFRMAQSSIRTALSALCRPPDLFAQASSSPMAQVLAHLKTAFPAGCPIAAYQRALRLFFL